MVGLLAGMPIWCVAASLASDTTAVAINRVGGVLVTLTIIAIAALIVTTPPDAIRLPPRRSVYTLTIATAWLIAWHVGVVEPKVGAILLALAFPIAAAFIAMACTRLRFTPWWAAVALWHPGFFGPVALPLFASAPLVIAAVVVLSIFAAARRPELTR